MEKYTIKEITTKKEWDKFVLASNPMSFLQSWNWGETNKILGKKIFRLGFFEKSKLKAVSLLIKEKAKRGPYLVVPGGPIVDWKNKTLVKFVYESIKRLGRQESVWFVRIRPELLDDDDSWKKFSLFSSIKSPMHLHAENTWVLDIDKSEEEILMGMRKNTRYLVRKSLNENLSLAISSDKSEVNTLVDLQEETVKRHKFIGFSKKIFDAEMDTFGKDNEACLFVIKKGKIPLAAAIIIFYGKYAYYHHSGSASLHKEIPSSYFMQWKVIQEARKRGLKGYNFWGIAPEGSKRHRFLGVTIFKTGFGGKRYDWITAHDIPISPLYISTYVFETIRRFSRGL